MFTVKCEMAVWMAKGPELVRLGCQGVEITDKAPQHIRPMVGDQYGFGADGNGASTAPHALPADVWVKVGCAWYSTEDQAVGALNEAAFRWAWLESGVTT